MKEQMDTFDKERTFKDLIDIKTVNDLAVNFKKLFRPGVALIDHQGLNLSKSHLEPEIFSKALSRGLQEIKDHELFPDFDGHDSCLFYRSSTSFDFAAFPIKHEFETIAVMVLGPFLLEDNKTAQSNVLTADFNLIEEDWDKLKYSKSSVIDMGSFFCGVFYHIIYANYKRLMASELHLESSGHSYQELIERNRELEASEKKYRELSEGLENEVEKRTRELRKTQLELFQREKMASVGKLAAGIAHEINNPTGFVHSNLGSLNKYLSRIMELLKYYEDGLVTLRSYGGEKIENLCQKIEELKKKLKIDFIKKDLEKLIAESLNGTERIKMIVADLKSFSHVDQAEFKHANINEGLETTLKVAWNELKYKCTVEKDYGDLPQTYCNPGQLNQVFMNLLINAAQAIDEKGAIRISTRYFNDKQQIAGGENQDHIEIKISDTGKGIPKDQLNRIFEPFYTTRKVGKGTGLGLSIAYDIIQKHKGEITVQSEVGKGTTFTIRLPMVLDPGSVVHDS